MCPPPCPALPFACRILLSLCLDMMVGSHSLYSTNDNHNVLHICDMPSSSGVLFIFTFIFISLSHIYSFIG